MDQSQKSLIRRRIGAAFRIVLTVAGVFLTEMLPVYAQENLPDLKTVSTPEPSLDAFIPIAFFPPLNQPSGSELLFQSQALLQRFQFKEASRKFRQALQTVHTADEAMAYGNTLLESGLPGLAEIAFQQAKQLGAQAVAADKGIKDAESRQKNAEYLLKQAISLIKKDKGHSPEKIELLFNQSLALNSASGKLHLAMAQYYELQKQNGKAVDHYIAYLQFNPPAVEQEKAFQALDRLSH